MSSLNELLGQIRSAPEGDRELDADIAQALGFEIEWKQANYTMEMYPVITWPPGREPCPRFTTSVDAALTLVAYVLPEWLGKVSFGGRGGFCWLWEPGVLSGDNAPAYGASPALAVVVALLSALTAQQVDDA